MNKTYPRFPLFIDLVGKKIVIVGGGRVASRRIQVLLPFGGHITVISPQWETPVEGVVWHQRPYEKGDLAGATLAVAATNHPEVNQRVGEDAHKLHIPVSVASDPGASSFYFPALCHGNDVVAGMVSQGGDRHHHVAKVAAKVRTILQQEGEGHEG